MSNTVPEVETLISRPRRLPCTTPAWSRHQPMEGRTRGPRHHLDVTRFLKWTLKQYLCDCTCPWNTPWCTLQPTNQNQVTEVCENMVAGLQGLVLLHVAVRGGLRDVRVVLRPGPATQMHGRPGEKCLVQQFLDVFRMFWVVRRLSVSQGCCRWYAMYLR